MKSPGHSHAPNPAGTTHLQRRVAFLAFGGLLYQSLDVGELRVDINRDSKNLDSVTETGYVKWSTDATNVAASGITSVSRGFTTSTSETVTVTFAQT